MHCVCSFLILLTLISTLTSKAQTQLVVLKKEKVLARYSEGQAITYRAKKSREYVITLIVKVQEFSLITAFDTIPFSSIERVKLKGRNTTLLNLVGGAVFYAGIGYYVLDEVNEIVIHGNGYDNDPAVWKPALIMVVSGWILKSIKKRSQKNIYPGKLLAAPPGSPFYLQEQL
jgi:hypothetical protein